MRSVIEISDSVAGTTETGYEYVDNDTVVFTGESTAVQLVWDVTNDIWRVMVFPVDPDKLPIIYHFSTREDAISGFGVWQNYYRTVLLPALEQVLG